MNNPTDNLTGSTSSRRTPNSDVASISENDDAVRNLKASESVVAAFSAANFPAPPAGIADVIASYVKGATRELPMKELANMAPGSGALGSSAAVGVNMFLNMLTPTQREAAKLGVNPLDPSAMMKFSAQLNGNAAGGGLMARGQGSEGQSSGARFDGMGSTGLTQIQLQTREYAIKQGVMWAADNHDILKLGPAAIDILAQTKLRKDVYEGLTKAGLSSKGSVGVAAMIHAQGGDANEGGKAVTESLKAIDDKAVTDAVNARATLQVPDRNETPQQKQAREAKIPAADHQVESAVGEHVKKNPAHGAHGQKLMKTLGVKLKEDAAASKVDAAHTTKAEVAVEANKSKQAFFSSGTPATASPSKPDNSVALQQRQVAATPKP